VTAGVDAGLPRLALSVEGFDELGEGRGGAAALAALRAGQITRRSAILLACARADAVARAALDVLAGAQRASASAAVRALRHPFLGAGVGAYWRGRTGDVGYLAGLAAAAALRAGVEAELEMPVRAGRVGFPSLGTLRLPGAATGVARISCAEGRLSVGLNGWQTTLDLAAGEHPPAWWPLRRVAAGGTELWIDDLDDQRDCFSVPPAQRLASPDFRRIRELVRDALALLHRRFPGEAQGLGILVTTLVPLRAQRDEYASASSRRASGSIGLHFPADPDVVALLLLHEYQHVKLGALLDLLDLVRPGGQPRHRVGWRSDPRPAGAVLQGAYAHLAVARFWMGRDGEAANRFVRTAEQVRMAIDVLGSSGELTPLGERFVARMLDGLRTTTGF
jgi:uncharacterized protein